MRLVAQIPPRRCTARSSRTGERCNRWALVGATTCTSHGAAAGHVRAAAARRVDLAEEIMRNPRRHALDIRSDALHSADILMRRARERYDAEETTETTVRLVECIERANRLAASAQDVDVAAIQRELATRVAGQMYTVFLRIVDGLELTAAQHARVPALFQRVIGEFEAGQRRAVEARTIEGEAETS